MKAPRSWRRRGILGAAILAVQLAAPAPSLAFAPKFHLAGTVEPLEGAQFSYGQVWMLAYFDIEVDLATEVPITVCRSILRWPTKDKMCISCFPSYEASDPCAENTCADIMANNCSPFHSPGNRPAKGLQKVAQEWRLASMAGALHGRSGERCYDWLVRYGHMLHHAQDFYAHANWVEVFHLDLGFDFDEIPTWTSFQKAQRGGKRNLILLQFAGGDSARAEALYDRLDQGLKVENHSLYNKDSNQESDGCYNDENRALHEDSHGHNVVDFNQAAAQLAGTETYQLGLQTRLNIERNAKLGSPAWSRLFQCVSEMATYDGESFDDELSTYKDAIWRLRTYGSIWGKWR